MGQWSDLPAGLMDTIDGLLSSYADKVRVRAVCVSWNSQLPKVDIPFPRLLQAFKNKSNSTRSAAIEIKSNPTHGLFNLLDKKFEFLDLPELQRKLFKGSSYGWVVAFDDSRGKTSPDIFLIDILTKVKIQLPPRYTFPDVHAYNVKRKNKEYSLHSPEGPYSVYSNYVHRNLIDKVVLSSSPSSGDSVVVAIYGAYGSLAWCKCNDKSWTSLCSNFGPRGENRLPFSDILFSDGRLYALNRHELLVFDHIDGPSQKLTKIASTPPDLYTSSFEYLGESSDGELLMVLRYLDDEEEHTMTFKVYKLDPINSSWVEVKNIGDDIMFLGLNPTLCISSHKYSGYKGNLIYFTDSSLPYNSKGSKEIVSDIGVFNMEDGSTELLPGFKGVPQFLWPPPIWVVL